MLAGSVGFSGRAWMVMGSVEAALPVSIWEESGHESGFFQKPDGPGSPYKRCRHGPCRSESGWDTPPRYPKVTPLLAQIDLLAVGSQKLRIRQSGIVGDLQSDSGIGAKILFDRFGGEFLFQSCGK